jgi:DNA-directed RNA polymerase subunit omega
MIEALKNDTIIKMVGGRFKLAALMQKRWVELMQGGRPLVECDDLTELDIIAKEILEGKITGELGEATPEKESTILGGSDAD